jgi:hypothetical protein
MAMLVETNYNDFPGPFFTFDLHRVDVSKRNDVRLRTVDLQISVRSLNPLFDISIDRHERKLN